jgi:putative NADPH-quinone reductase
MRSPTIRKVAIIQGHPDAGEVHLCHALADAYAEGAQTRVPVNRIEVAKLEFPLLRCKEDWEMGNLPAGLEASRTAVAESDHLVFVFPLWLGTMPAMLKAYLEQLMRPGFAFSARSGPKGWRPALRGRSARIIVTMGMPAAYFKWYYLAHGVKVLDRNILRFCGFAPVRETYFGMIERTSVRSRAKWLAQVRKLGEQLA